ncbi:ABC transporter ATP-binding protein [Chlamydia sp.]|uniref:ATP-binding cassette domain-containing protein n=1 Tax=Chlamydia sp. TaxID=35827 RepID=UPI0025C19FAE|nr:ABC transporter ATP-binding protein [Chlamydia sp.]MBQ8498384.1 ABC transporter ATP-binding protein [Chlamydia sp.]
MLDVKSLYYAHASHCVFENAEVSFSPGQISVVLGKSGSGKTTLFRIIAGFLSCSIGEILWEGKPLTQKLVAYMQQKGRLLPWRTIRKNISLLTELGPRNQKMFVLEKAFRKAVHTFELSSLLDRFPDELSVGQQQRVVFAMHSLSSKPVLLLDEPFASLDPLTKEMLYQDVKRLAKEEGKTVILASHDVQDCLRVGETFFAIKNHKIQPVFLDKQEGISGLLQQMKKHLI